MGEEIIIKNGKTEITMNEQEISVSAPKIEIESDQESDKAVFQQSESKIKETIDGIKEWFEWNVTPIVVLSLTALLISIASATLSIYRLVQYLISH